MAEGRVKRRLSAILAADVVGYTRLMEQDEAGTLERLKTLRQTLVDPAIAAHAGRLIKLIGDGALVEFASAVDALACAMTLQAQVAAHEAAVAPDGRLRLRIGINLGDVIVEDDDIYGEGVNIAARLEALAEPGGICISRAVAEQVEGKLDCTLEALGELAVKNLVRPVAAYRVTVSGGPNPPRRAPGPAAKPAIAVLAFADMGGDGARHYFADGIAEDIITDLAKLQGLHVIARNSSFRYKDRSVHVAEIARELGVRYVLEGSVRAAGNRVRVSAQLIDATTGGHLWAERYDRELTDIFAVQDELTREIVTALAVRLRQDERARLGRRHVPNLEAYQLYIRGREQTWLHTRASNAAAMRLFEQAIAIEPDYPAAKASIAFLHFLSFVNGWADDPPAALARARALADAVIAFDPEEPLGHFALAVTCSWQKELDLSLAAAQRCLELAPGSVDGHLPAARSLIFMDRAEEAIAHIQTALRLDPLCPEIALHFLAEAHMSRGDYPAAAEALQKRLARNPDSATAQALLASVLGHLGEAEAARRAWAETLRLDPTWSIERRRQILPFRDPAQFERRVEGLRLAGIVP